MNASQSLITSKENDWRLLLTLVPYARRHSRLLVIALIFLIPMSIAGAVQPLIIGEAISLLRQETTWFFLDNLTLTQGLHLLIGLFFFTILLRLIFVSIQGYLVQQVGQEITAEVRQDLFTHVTSLGSRFFHGTPVGKLVTRITNDVEALGEVFASGAIGILSDIVYILVMLVTILTLQWQLALVLILMLVPVTGLIIYFQNQYRIANYQAREELSQLNSILQENIAGINIVQLFRREKFNSEAFRAVNERYRTQVDKTIFHDSAVSATLEWISIFSIAGVLWVGGMFVLQDNLELGTITTFIIYSPRLFFPLRQFAEKFTMFQAGFTAIERIQELMSEPIEIKDSNPVLGKEEQLAGNHKGEIRFEHVWFAYKDKDYVLKDLNLTIRGGKKVALVGPTGAGKSSIISLLCRLYEPSRGRILVNGIDIRQITQTELRRYIGVILQESFLFAGDVKRNITLGESYQLETIKEAAQLTNVAQFIEALPEGYNTQLRERGTNLSGGQKQLLAFARVAIRDPEVLVLDEATSSLDVATERSIQSALEQLLVSRTAIIIAHRLSTIRNVDKIIVLKQGEIVESGTHDILLAQGGLYASLYQLQMLGTSNSYQLPVTSYQ
ncbi:MAG: ABC transporter ATP-binding protein [Prochloron sp. SP5CPC1]|nr:ABC transporter ATP-binding protein [Candidatus Paraprochloron terpiosi SP5CPC1]